MQQRRLRLVVVDDDDDIRQLLSLALSSDAVDLVGTARDGQHAVEVVKDVEPDVVVMDLLMPGMDGVEATALIKEAQPDVAIIGFTAVADERGADLLNAGAVAVVDKSKFQELLAVVAAWTMPHSA